MTPVPGTGPGPDVLDAGLDPRVTWGVVVRHQGPRDDGTAEVLRVGADRVLPTASVGKVLLLLAVAERLDDGCLDPAERLRPHPDDLVADSGLWQHLDEPSLSVASAAALVGAVSDNLATNVLLRRVGLPACTDVAARLGLHRTALHDRVRDARGPADPPTLSTATAAELADLAGRLRTGSALGGPDDRVRRWLALDADLSMTLAPLGLDPLAHTGPDRGVSCFHKTGTDDGIRADTGSVTGPGGSVDHAVLAWWDPAGPDLREAALAGHHAVGRLVRRLVTAGRSAAPWP